MAPFWYLKMVFTHHTASSAVSGTPSLHLPPGLRWNVQVRPSFDSSQLVAQSGAILRPGPYWTSCG